MNMLASQIKEYRDDLAENHTTLSKSELARTTSLGTYVINNLEKDLRILILSKHLGLSPKKLQVGVRYLYGDSVGHYILNLRMGLTKHLFNITDLNIAEVCTRV